MAGKYSGNDGGGSGSGESHSNNPEDENYDKVIEGIPSPEEMDEEYNRVEEAINEKKQMYSPNEDENIGFISAANDRNIQSAYGDFDPITGAYDSRNHYPNGRTEEDGQYNKLYDDMIDAMNDAQHYLGSASGHYAALQNENLSDGWYGETPRESAENLRNMVEGDYIKYQEARDKAINNLNEFHNYADGKYTNGNYEPNNFRKIE